VSNNAALLAAQPPQKTSKGSQHTPSVDELYGPLIKAGLVRIIRRKGRPPLIRWL
jgi:hypothetical protein